MRLGQFLRGVLLTTAVLIWLLFVALSILGPTEMTVTDFGARSNGWSLRPTQIIPSSEFETVSCPEVHDPRKFHLSEDGVKFSTQNGLFADEGVLLLVDLCETDLIGFPHGPIRASFFGSKPLQTLHLVDPLPLYRALSWILFVLVVAPMSLISAKCIRADQLSGRSSTGRHL
jgi:hypothetical protein